MISFKEFFKKDIVKKLLVLVLLIFFLYLMKSMLNLFLLTFLFTYLIFHLRNFILDKIRISFKFDKIIVTITLYLLIILVIALIINEYIPEVITQSNIIINNIKSFKGIDALNINAQLKKLIVPLFDNIDLKEYFSNGANYIIVFAKSIGQWSFNIFVSIILSMFFMIEEDKIQNFLSAFKTSRLSWAYKYLNEIGENFLNSFGKVIQAQILIAITNSILSVISLFIIGFPQSQLLALGAMIFVLSLVPVAGVVISLIPLCIIGFNIGGIIKVVYVLIMIACLHGLESYFLNPKFMSDKTKLPVFFIFITLIVSEHFLGVWGLLIGIPLFIFFLDLLNVKVQEKHTK